nr:submaxillary gland androgen-regulated protein 3B isoform X1 [Salvelinus alpinus]
MGCLLSLRDLVIHSNDLRVLPACLCLDKLDKLKVDVRNNPLGRPPTPPPLPPTPGEYHSTTLPPPPPTPGEYHSTTLPPPPPTPGEYH